MYNLYKPHTRGLMDFVRAANPHHRDHTRQLQAKLDARSLLLVDVREPASSSMPYAARICARASLRLPPIPLSQALPAAVRCTRPAGRRLLRTRPLGDGAACCR